MPPEQVGKLLFPTMGPGNPGRPTALETFHTRGKAVLCRERVVGEQPVCDLDLDGRQAWAPMRVPKVC
jgi:hypothetical protein